MRRKAPGGGPPSSQASRRSTSGSPPRWSPCRARRRAIAARSGSTRSARITGGRSSPGKRMASGAGPRMSPVQGAWRSPGSARSCPCPAPRPVNAPRSVPTAPTAAALPSYVVSETRGVWHKAVRLPGVTIDAISCGAAGHCVAAGYSVAHLITSSGHAITVGEVRGKWGKPHDLTGAPAKATGAPRFTAVSCRSAGNCSAGGDYATKDGVQAFVATESKGAWRKAQELPGIAALNVGRNSALFSLSCASAGNCSTGGYYVDAKGVFQAFVADERGGTWARAQEVPGTAALNIGPVGFTAAQVNVLSCRSPGSCSAAGFYTDKKGSQQVFTDSQTRGGWAKATEVPGTGALNSGGTADLVALSCASAGELRRGRLLHRRTQAPARVRSRPAQRYLGPGTAHRGPRVAEPPRVRGQPGWLRAYRPRSRAALSWQTARSQGVPRPSPASAASWWM